VSQNRTAVPEFARLDSKLTSMEARIEQIYEMLSNQQQYESQVTERRFRAVGEAGAESGGRPGRDAGGGGAVSPAVAGRHPA